MGTYWTINPREYADPRKHGPEYLARARRATGPGDPSGGPSHGGDRPRGSAAAASGATADPAEPATDADADAADGDWAWSGRAQTTTGGDAAGWAARSWTYDTRDPGPTWTQGREGRATGTAPRSPWPAATDAPPLPDLEALLRRLSPGSLLDLARRRRRWRLVLALVAWPPIGYLLSTLVLDSTGCSSYTAACPEEIRVPLVLAQLLLVLVLFAVPTLTAVAGFGSLVAFAVALPVAAILSPGVGPRAPVTSMILDVAFVAAYVAGLAFAAWRLSRRSTAPDPATPPGP
jgi:hypothetical protein